MTKIEYYKAFAVNSVGKMIIEILKSLLAEYDNWSQKIDYTETE